MQNNIESLFVPYEQALELKELGFDEPCLAYLKPNVLTYEITIGEFNEFEYHSAPTFSQAFRWFREKYDLFSYIDILERQNGEVIYDYVIVNNDLEESEDDRKWNTFKEAELECLKKLIEIVKNK